jgi:hypothetical protein
VPFSAASFIAKSNNIAPGAPPASVGIGGISDDGAGHNLGSPVSNTAPNLAPVQNFYDNGTFGRSVYVVLPTTIAHPTNTNLFKSQREMFVNDNTLNGGTALICNADNQGTVHDFGFTSISTAGECGTFAHTGDFQTGAS